jgi:hypothetical protein
MLPIQGIPRPLPDRRSWLTAHPTRSNFKNEISCRVFTQLGHTAETILGFGNGSYRTKADPQKLAATAKNDPKRSLSIGPEKLKIQLKQLILLPWSWLPQASLFNSRMAPGTNSDSDRNQSRQSISSVSIANSLLYLIVLCKNNSNYRISLHNNSANALPGRYCC